MNADYIDASDVSVEVKDGKVTLEGTVLQRRMKHAIEDIVDDCIGVKDIDNKVRVSQGEERRSETNTSIGSSQSSGGRA
jgi:osmotically-inducible protein OsmY